MYFPGSDVKVSKPAFLIPIYAMNMPIPPPIACCNEIGIDFISSFLTFVIVIRIFKRPQINTIASASCYLKPKPKHTVKVKNALSPIPGACAYGTFAKSPIISVPIIDAIIVDKNTAPHGIPV